MFLSVPVSMASYGSLEVDGKGDIGQENGLLAIQ
jgi:hypothetical protein